LVEVYPEKYRSFDTLLSCVLGRHGFSLRRSSTLDPSMIMYDRPFKKGKHKKINGSISTITLDIAGVSKSNHETEVYKVD